MLNLRMKIIEWLLGGLEYVLIAHIEGKNGVHHGAVLTQVDDKKDHLQGIIASGMEGNEDIKSIILDGAKKYFSRYEIDSRNFALEIYPTR